MDEQPVGICVPIGDVPEGERGSSNGMALRDYNVTDLPGVSTVVIQIELVRSTIVVSLVSVVGAVIGVTRGWRCRKG